MMKLINFLREKLGGFFRPIRNIFAKHKYRKHKKISPTIISQNCIGGVIYHDFGLRFNSPTINCFMSASDFVRFCENLSYYLSIDANEIKFIKTSEIYPIGLLDDLKIYFVHYNNETDVIAKWNRRRGRVDFNNVYLVLTDRDGFNEEVLSRYIKLPYKKIIFSHINHFLEEEVYMPCFKNCESVGGLTQYCSIFGKRYYEKYFDVLKWLRM